MASVVTDNSPIDVLVRMGRADLLPRLFGQVVMPREVWEELQSPSTPAPTRRWLERPPSWLTIRRPNKIEAIPSLHAGEEAAIALAIELDAHYLLIDEARGRSQAGHRDVQVVGTLGVLSRAAELGWLDLREAFIRLPNDFRASPELLSRILEEHEVDGSQG